jgi:hypothetical protein
MLETIVSENQDFVENIGHAFPIMMDHQKGFSVPHQVFQDVDGQGFSLFIDSRQGLIQKKQLAVLQEQSGQVDPALFTSGQGGKLRVPQVRYTHPVHECPAPYPVKPSLPGPFELEKQGTARGNEFLYSDGKIGRNIQVLRKISHLVFDLIK